MLITLLAILWAIVWGLTVFDMIRRRDMSTWSKVLWAIVVLIFPIVGILVYLIVRPWAPSEPRFPDGTPAPKDVSFEQFQDRHPV